MGGVRGFWQQIVNNSGFLSHMIIKSPSTAAGGDAESGVLANLQSIGSSDRYNGLHSLFSPSSSLLSPSPSPPPLLSSPRSFFPYLGDADYLCYIAIPPTGCLIFRPTSESHLRMPLSFPNFVYNKKTVSGLQCRSPHFEILFWSDSTTV